MQFKINKKLFNIFILMLISFILIPSSILHTNAYENYGGYDWAGFKGECNYARKHPEDTDYIANVKKQIWLYLVNNGYTEQAAAGVMGNIQAECGFDPTVTEGWVEWENFPWWSEYAGGGLGMVGFTAISVKTELGEACVKNNVEWTCLDVQLKVGIAQIENAIVRAPHDNTFNKDPEAMKKSTSIRDVAVAVVMNYEICQGYNTEAVWSKRSGFGEAIYNELKGTKGDYDPKNNPTPVGGDAKGKITNDKEEYEKDPSNSVLVEEWDCRGMPDKPTYIEEYGNTEYTMLTKDKLSLSEQNQLGLLKASVDSAKEVDNMNMFRQTIMCIGIFLCIYSLVLLLAAIFDMVNTLTDFSLLHILSFGLIKFSADSDLNSSGFSFEVIQESNEFRKIAGMIISLFAIGLGIISGSYFSKFLQISTFVLDNIGNFFH